MKIMSVGSFNVPGTQFKIFNWTGVDWTLGNVGAQWIWAVVFIPALALALGVLSCGSRVFEVV
ncbi:MAG: hypothetical protein P8Z00_10860 [Anaerolineales bacterium]